MCYYHLPFPCGRVIWIQLQTLLLSLSLSLRILRVVGTAFIEESRHGAALYPACRRESRGLKMRVSKRRGISYVEALAATLILSISFAAMISVLGNVYNLTSSVDRTGLTTAIARRALENARSLGFTNVAEGSTTEFYNAHGISVGSIVTADTAYQAVTSTTSDEFQVAQGGGSVPGDFALRRVVVVVYNSTTKASLATAGTFLTRGGL